MALPWIFKIFLAICSDNVTLCGSRRKSYLIINSSVNILSMVLLMALGIMLGKVFIMFCIVTSQIAMTWCDALSDALIAQASRFDLKNGAANLNVVTSIAYAFGGITACVCGGFIEIDDGHDVDPNFYFGTYAALIFGLLIAAICLDKNNEPEILRLTKEERARLGERSPENLGASCSLTFSSIWRLLSYRQFFLPILFFFIQGAISPNFDDVHYVFLTETVQMPKWQYDFLNTISYVAMLVFIFFYSQYLSKTEVWILVEVSLALLSLMNGLMLINATRANIEWGIPDEAIVALIFLFSTQSVSLVAIVPTQVQLTYLVPENVEASTMALVTGTFVWSYEVGAKLSSSIYCQIF